MHLLKVECFCTWFQKLVLLFMPIQIEFRWNIEKPFSFTRWMWLVSNPGQRWQKKRTSSEVQINESNLCLERDLKEKWVLAHTFSLVKRKQQQAKYKYQTVLPKKDNNLCSKTYFCIIHGELDSMRAMLRVATRGWCGPATCFDLAFSGRQTDFSLFWWWSINGGSESSRVDLHAG